MSRTILDIHILQTVPPSNLNRDDTGTPKTAIYGGVRRARVSSQAWKRATRKSFNELLPPEELGVRTKKVAELLAERIMARSTSLDEAVAWDLAAEMIRTATGSKIEVPKRKAKGEEEAQLPPESSYLMFLSRRQIEALAELAVTGGQGDLKTLQAFFKVKENKALAKAAVNTRHSVDIALFGRMVADAADINVEAATQVAHALSVHAVDIESDYYTAVDDRKSEDESGAGMIGSIDFNSSTLYRYAAVDIDGLHKNLGSLTEDENGPSPVRRAATAFLDAFVTSLPTGKTNTFGNQTLPAAVIVKLRSRRPVSFVSAFETPVRQREGGGYLAESCKQLTKYVPNLEAGYGIADVDGSWVLRIGEETADLESLGVQVTLPELLEAVGAAIDARMMAAR
ncbi:type I-E CRISPR-associated protein Cas7/Cse4/CasC [Actinocorallia sp. A-T 12471]|uniref:type I-E CRISPR-associated protein Cas7/Cse4/CasC n=1 Tax=Actinocorallia sp. A-T 12471 TaxID=3089813 RepID=UPI0029CF403F|nr:type I-E CRISPR-associated protein Cas7/Cse4/CasC [Actinocorallia sp. A-T 12471]MDX6740992.1 type I-E CRISPR-associated protein Cas7/Cse4/CasC [Actinocorallia sp. A-T 12471]